MIFLPCKEFSAIPFLILQQAWYHSGSEIVDNVSSQNLTVRFNKAWSIQEHIGHLLDLEELHVGRIDDFIARKKILRAADMSNAKTIAADHNHANIHHMLNDFNNSRDELIKRLEALDNKTQKFQALHPRLQIMMRPVDMAYFTAEHDDHHIASMRIAMNNLE